MKISEILVESKSSDLYHGTNLYNAEKIVSSDTFTANRPINTDKIPKAVAGHNRTVSFTRDPAITAKFMHGDFGTDVGVVFVIDQGLLSRDLGKRLQPYSDVDTEVYRAQAERWGNEPKADTSSRSRGTTESEEVVFGNLTNANKYIKKIILITWDSKDANADRRAHQIRNSPLLNDPRAVVSDGATSVYSPKKFVQFYNDSKEKPAGPPGFLRKTHQNTGY